MRAILQMNADEIVRNNQALAYGKCSNVVPINDGKEFLVLKIIYKCFRQLFNGIIQ